MIYIPNCDKYTIIKFPKQDTVATFDYISLCLKVYNQERQLDFGYYLVEDIYDEFTDYWEFAYIPRTEEISIPLDGEYVAEMWTEDESILLSTTFLYIGSAVEENCEYVPFKDEGSCEYRMDMPIPVGEKIKFTYVDGSEETENINRIWTPNAYKRYDTTIKKIECGTNIQQLRNYTFADCPALEVVKVPSVQVFDGSFANCRGIKKIYIPSPATFNNNFMQYATSAKEMCLNCVDSFNNRMMRGVYLNKVILCHPNADFCEFIFNDHVEEEGTAYTYSQYAEFVKQYLPEYWDLVIIKPENIDWENQKLIGVEGYEEE